MDAATTEEGPLGNGVRRHLSWGVGGILATTIMDHVRGIGYILCGPKLGTAIIAYSLAHMALVIQLDFAAVPA